LPKTSRSEHSNVNDVLDEVIAHVGDCADCSEKAEMLESIRLDIAQSVCAGPSGRGGNSEDMTALIENSIVTPGDDKFCDLIGHDEVKLLLVQSLALPIKQPQLFDNSPPCRRILLYGPPGTGKTSIAKCLASEVNIPLLTISCSSLLSPYLGEAEKNLKSFFEYARKNSTQEKPVVIFIDEIDAIGRVRTCKEEETTRRLKSELLCQIDGITTSDDLGDEPFIFGCTNCPWDLDPAVLRRFSRRIFVDLPNSQDALSLLNNLIKSPKISESDWLKVEHLVKNYSGADLVNLANFVKHKPINEVIMAEYFQFQENGKLRPIRNSDSEENLDYPKLRSKWDELPDRMVEARSISIEDVIEAFDEIKPTVNDSLYKKYATFRNQS